MASSMPALYRSRDDAILAGVCFALAQRLRVDPLLVRVAAVLLALSSGFGVALYAWAWLMLPQQGRSRSFAQQWLPQLDGWSPQQQLTAGLVGSLVCTVLLGPLAAWSIAPGIVLLIMVALARRQRPSPEAPSHPAVEALPVAPNSDFARAADAWAQRLHSIEQETASRPRPLQEARNDASAEATVALELEPTRRLTWEVPTEATVPLPPHPGDAEPTVALHTEATRQLAPPPPPIATAPIPPAAQPPGNPYLSYPPPSYPSPSLAPAAPRAIPPTTAGWPAAPAPERPRRLRKSWLLGLLVLALALGAAQLAGQFPGAGDVPVTDQRLLQHGAALAVLALALLGCALLRLPRPRMAVLAGLLVVASAVAPPIDGSAVQPRDVVWTSTSQLPDGRVDLAATEGRFDLSQLDLSRSGASPATLNIRATAADVQLVLPDDADVRVDYDLTAADLSIVKGGSDFSADGQRHGSWPEHGSEHPQLVVTLELRAASAEVSHA